MTMTGYTKLFSSILMSSVWEESHEVRLVWITMLALADQDGHVDGTAKSLARVARVSVDACQSALDCLLGPDPNDRSGVMEGRRIVAEQGGWRLVNYGHYRAKMSAEDRKERDRIRKRKARMSAERPHVSANVRDFQQAEAEAKADTEADTEAEKSKRVPTAPLMDLWNELTVPPLPKCLTLTPKRKTHIKARMAERSLDDWRVVVSKIAASDFCRGLTGRGWVASFDWMIASPDAAVKVLEGKYDNHAAAPKAPERPTIYFRKDA